MNNENAPDSETQNRQKKKHQMVLAAHKKNKESGKFQTINEIFARLPLPRLQKNSYKFLFENLKDNIEIILQQTDNIRNVQNSEKQAIDAIDVKLVKPFDLPDANLDKQCLQSNRPLFKSLVYLRNQKPLMFDKNEGEVYPFIKDCAYLDLDKISNQIPNLRLFLQDEEPLSLQHMQFCNENEIIFANRHFPASYDIDKRAEVLAKLYLLDLYRQQSRKMVSLDRHDEEQLQKKRQINKIKQDIQKQKISEGQLIEEVDLMKQVIRIMELIEKKMNAWAYEEFKNKNGEKATQIKKSLQKLKHTIDHESESKVKLKLLILYKHKKGW